MDALQKRKNLAAARKKYRPLNQAEIMIRRRRLRELFGCGYTKGQMREILSAYMVEKGYPEVSQKALDRDLNALARDYRETIAQDIKNLVEQEALGLTMLEQHQWEDYFDARENDKNPAMLSDNIRKTKEARQKLLGLHVQKHQLDGKMTVEHRLQEILSIKPETTEILELLPDDDFTVRPVPRLTGDA